MDKDHKSQAHFQCADNSSDYHRLLKVAVMNHVEKSEVAEDWERDQPGVC